MKHYVYRHIRLDKNEPFYIGIGTKYNKNYFNSHKTEYHRAYTKIGRGDIWNKIINKTNYKIEILFESNDYNLIKEKEIEFIKLYGRINKNTGILSNLTDGGDGSFGLILSEEAKQKLRIHNLGKKASEETKKKIRLSHLGKKRSKETCINISKAKKGKPISEITRKALKLKIQKAILQYDLQGNFIKEWDCIADAGRELNINVCHVPCCAKGKVKSCQGYIWKYKN